MWVWGLPNPANTRRFAHTLKSVAGNIGATRLKFAASVLDACLQTPGSQAAVEASLADVRGLLDALCAQLQQGLGIPAAHPVSFAVGDTSAPFIATPSAPHASNPGEALAVCLQRKALLNAMAAFDFELAGQILNRGPLHRFGMPPS